MYPSQYQVDMAEWDYAIASRNIYDHLVDLPDTDNENIQRPTQANDMDRPEQNLTMQTGNTRPHTKKRRIVTNTITNYMGGRKCPRGWSTTRIESSTDELIGGLLLAVKQVAEWLEVDNVQWPTISYIRRKISTLLMDVDDSYKVQTGEYGETLRTVMEEHSRELDTRDALDITTVLFMSTDQDGQSLRVDPELADLIVSIIKESINRPQISKWLDGHAIRVTGTMGDLAIESMPSSTEIIIYTGIGQHEMWTLNNRTIMNPQNGQKRKKRRAFNKNQMETAGTQTDIKRFFPCTPASSQGDEGSQTESGNTLYQPIDIISGTQQRNDTTQDDSESRNMECARGNNNNNREGGNDKSGSRQEDRQGRQPPVLKKTKAFREHDKIS